jgi:glutathione S-transferase
MAEIEIFSANACPYAQRTRMMLTEKGIPFTLTEIDLRNKPVWFKDVSPYGKVPVIRHRGQTIYESAIINEYLEETFPEPPLMPNDPAGRAKVRIWIDYANSRIAGPFFHLLVEKNPAKRVQHAKEFLAAIRFVEDNALGAGWTGPHWLGRDLSLADLTYFPYAERFALVEHYRGIDAFADCHNLKRWYDAMRQRPAARATGNSREFYVEKYRDLVAA